MNSDQINKWLTALTNVGVLVGIALLVLELDQNAKLMRAEIHSMRAEAKADRQMGLANSGETSRIMYTAYAEGFPANPDALAALTGEDRFRLGIFLSGLKEVVANWHYQCQQELLDVELCRSSYRWQAKNLIPLLHAADLGLENMRESFVEDLRKIAKEEGLPVPNRDGSW